MRRILLRPNALAAALLVAGAAVSCAAPGSPGEAPATTPRRGGVVAIGGGSVPDRIYGRMLALTGVEDPAVLVLPLATTRPESSGPATAERFRSQGARRVEWRHFDRHGAARSDVVAAIDAADVVYFPGGSQSRLLAILRGTPAEAAVAGVVARGGVVGGTSAGCAVLGDLSFTGRARLDLAVAGATEREPGLGLVRGALLDQHFLRRGRMLRLLSAVLDDPTRLGIGVDESTAVVAPNGSPILEVIGERQVAILRVPDGARRGAAAPGDLHRAEGIVLHLLAEGDLYDRDAGRVILRAGRAVAPPADAERPRATTERL